MLRALCVSLTLALLLAPIPISAQTRLPDLPGAVSVDRTPRDPLRSTEAALSPFTVTIQRSDRFSRDIKARFTIQNPAQIERGRIDLILLDQETTDRRGIRFYLHGQKTETMQIEPGNYVLRAYFWRGGRNQPVPYPLTIPLALRPGDSAMLELSKADQLQISAWLRAVESSRKSE